MTAAGTHPKRGTSAAPPIVLRDEVFDALTAERGATNDSERARLVGINRATLYRLRKHRFAPRMDVAHRIAERLDTTVDQLFERVAA